MKEVIEKATDAFTFENRLEHLQEESAELIVAISHLRRNRIYINELIEELVDVKIILAQIEMKLDRLGYKNEIKSITDFKISRLDKLLNKSSN